MRLRAPKVGLYGQIGYLIGEINSGNPYFFFFSGLFLAHWLPDKPVLRSELGRKTGEAETS
jgi:hypothetical protein